MSRNHEKLRVFQVADSLALRVYLHTASFPATERFGLQSQMRRAAVSVPTNIVQGCARRSRADYARFIDIALASATEADYLLDLSRRLGMLSPAAYAECRSCTNQLLPGLQKLLQSIETLDP
jgi:four helix bundle protein